jgi:predicted mannosyl-3-phosphoglycerate phosphatase (HAD superfamily)
VAGTGVSLVIFADIDGVLSAVPRAALAKDLRTLEGSAGNAAVVLCSGRTRPELEHLSQELGSRYPFICEHGAAAFVPVGYFPFDVPNSGPIAGYQAVEFGRSAASVLEVLRRTADRHGVTLRAFSEMSVEEVARDCGLSLLCARLAKLRDYGELFRVLNPNPDVRARFLDALRAAHLRCVVGERYDHVGSSVDISIGVGMLRTLYRRLHTPTLTVGIADWQAEGDVLQLVDAPVTIEAPGRWSGQRPARKPHHLRAVRLDGPVSWANRIAEIAQDLHASALRL